MKDTEIRVFDGGTPVCTCTVSELPSPLLLRILGNLKGIRVLSGDGTLEEGLERLRIEVVARQLEGRL